MNFNTTKLEELLATLKKKEEEKDKNTVLWVLAIIGAVGILFMSGRDKKNPFLRLALGAYDLYNITGWVSDILSYSRLLALGLATLSLIHI